MTQEPNKEQNPEQVTLPAGTIVKVRGIPFKLPTDTIVLGSKANLDLALIGSLAGGKHCADTDKCFERLAEYDDFKRADLNDKLNKFLDGDLQ